MNYLKLDNKIYKIKYKYEEGIKGYIKRKNYIIIYCDDNEDLYNIQIYKKNKIVFKGKCKNIIFTKKKNNNLKNFVYLKKDKYSLTELINMLDIISGKFYMGVYKLYDRYIYSIKKDNQSDNGYKGKIVLYNNTIYDGFFEFLKNKYTMNIFSVFLKEGQIIYRNGDKKRGVFNLKSKLDGKNCENITKTVIDEGEFIDGEFVHGTRKVKNGTQYGKFKNNILFDGQIEYDDGIIIKGIWKENIFVGKYCCKNNYTYEGEFSNYFKSLKGKIIYDNEIIYDGMIYNNILKSGYFVIPEKYIFISDIMCEKYKLYYYYHLKTFKGFTTDMDYKNYVTKIYFTDDKYIDCLLDKDIFLNLDKKIYDYLFDLCSSNKMLSIEMINNIIITCARQKIKLIKE
jgi:hypothetical protein